MKQFLILIFLFVSVSVMGQMQSANYKSGVNGLFTHGAITTSINYKSQLVNIWTEGHSQASTHYKNRLNIGVVSDTNTTQITYADKSIKSVLIYPNPFRQILQVEFTKADVSAEVEIFSMAGQAVFQKHSSTGTKIELDLSKLKVGVYFLKIKVANQIITERITKI